MDNVLSFSEWRRGQKETQLLPTPTQAFLIGITLGFIISQMQF